MSANITNINSKDELDKCVANGITLVDFWAPWCGPCRMQLPILDDIAKTYDGKAKIVKVNVDDNSELASIFGVSSVPSLFLFKNGVIVQQYTGVQSEKVLSNALSKEI